MDAAKGQDDINPHLLGISKATAQPRYTLNTTTAAAEQHQPFKFWPFVTAGDFVFVHTRYVCVVFTSR